MGLFGSDYPPGCHSTPFDEDYPCAVCGGWDVDPRLAKPHAPACICPECPECGTVGDPKCYMPKAEGGHGLELSVGQKEKAAAVLEALSKAEEDIQEFLRDCAKEEGK